MLDVIFDILEVVTEARSPLGALFLLILCLGIIALIAIVT